MLLLRNENLCSSAFFQVRRSEAHWKDWLENVSILFRFLCRCTSLLALCIFSFSVGFKTLAWKHDSRKEKFLKCFLGSFFAGSLKSTRYRFLNIYEKETKRTEKFQRERAKRLFWCCRKIKKRFPAQI